MKKRSKALKILERPGGAPDRQPVNNFLRLVRPGGEVTSSKRQSPDNVTPTLLPPAANTSHETSDNAGSVITKRVFPWKSLWLLATAVWLQGVVIIFIVLVLQREVETPVTDWLKKAMNLLGM